MTAMHAVILKSLPDCYTQQLLDKHYCCRHVPCAGLLIGLNIHLCDVSLFRRIIESRVPIKPVDKIAHHRCEPLWTCAIKAPPERRGGDSISHLGRLLCRRLRLWNKSSFLQRNQALWSWKACSDKAVKSVSTFNPELGWGLRSIGIVLSGRDRSCTGWICELDVGRWK